MRNLSNNALEYQVYEYQEEKENKKIPVIRCVACEQHLGMYSVSISKKGIVSPDLVCPNCKTVQEKVELSNLKGLSKNAGEVFIK